MVRGPLTTRCTTALLALARREVRDAHRNKFARPVDRVCGHGSETAISYDAGSAAAAGGRSNTIKLRRRWVSGHAAGARKALRSAVEATPAHWLSVVTTRDASDIPTGTSRGFISRDD